MIGRLTAVSLAVVAVSASRAASADSGLAGAKVIGIADGDTLTVLVKRTQYRIRLAGIDAPERKQAFGRKAKQRLSALAFGKVVDVKVLSLDRYGRLVAEVRVGGRSCGEVLVREGLAWHFTRYSSDKTLAALEREARADRTGLWSTAHPVPPWEYRSAAKGRSRAARTDPGVRPRSEGGREAWSGPVRGNRRSRIFHWKTCPSFERIAPRNRVPFDSPGQAKAAGYRAAKNCPGRIP